jgi:soluble lytic murein transglycosylase-like protein
MSVPAWKLGGELYLPALAVSERNYGIPTDLLARVAFQECSWRVPVIDYTVQSDVGAMGMFQLMPADFPDVGKGWQSDMAIAAGELVRLYHHFIDWQDSIAAYDWGQGNVDKWLARGAPWAVLPNETQNYVTKVFADVPISGSILA